MAFGSVKGTWTFTANSIVASNAATLATGSAVVAKGDLIVVVIGEQTGNTSTGATDTRGNTYTAVTAGTLGGSISGRAFYTIVTNAGTNTNINVAATASSNNVAIVAACYEGSFSAIDANPANNNNTDNASPFTCPATGTLAQQVEIIVAWMTGVSNATWSATSPNLKDNQAISQSVANTILGHQVVNATSTVSPAFTGTNPTGSQQGTVSFKASALPFNQTDWPLTIAQPFWTQLRTYTYGRPVQLYQTTSPFAQYQWPLPTPQRPAIDLRTWIGQANTRMQLQPCRAAFQYQAFQGNAFQSACFPDSRITNWPNQLGSRPAYPIDLRTWFGKNPPAVADTPFAQTNWPNPTAAAYQVQLRSWFGKVPSLLEVPFVKTDWPNPRGYTYAVDLRSFIETFPLVLIGQDSMTVGDIWMALPPKPYEYHAQLRTWTWQYNINLIGKDELPIGDIIIDRPTLAPLLLQTWINTISIALTTETRPFFQLDWPLTPAAAREVNLSTWLQTTKLLLAAVEAPFKQTDWPLTPAFAPLSKTSTAFFNPNLIGQDALPFRQDRWPLTPAAERSIELRTWLQSTKLLLLVPFRQTDWPNPAPQRRAALSWTASFPLTLIGQDAMTVGEALTDLPPQPARRAVQLRTWIDTVNLALTTQAGVLPFNQYDWPINRGPKQPTSIFVASFNKNLIGKDQLPFRQQDWPNPRQFARQPDLATWIDRAKFFLQPPHRQQQWPLPVRRTDPAMSWTASFPLPLVGADKLPFRQQEWPVPRDPRQVREWNNPLRFWLYYAIAPLPFNQYAWPLPGQPAPLWSRYHFEWQGNNLLPIWVNPIPPVPPPTPPTDSRIAYNSGNEWQMIDRIKEPGPVGWR